MKLVVGLGNPGKKYKNTRHNMGFLCVDELISTYHLSPISYQKKLDAEITSDKLKNNKIIIIKPQTFMNESGKSVRAAMDFYKIKSSDLIVIHDDKDLKLGDIKIQIDRSSAGHNGVQSIIDRIETQNFTRVRVGIAPADPKLMGDASNFVLGKFNKHELPMINQITQEAVSKIKDILNVKLKIKNQNDNVK